MRYYWLLLLLAVACSQEPQQGEALPAVDYVDTFIGTGGHGHTYPGATLPFGMVQLSPDTRLEGWDGCGGYHFTDSLIYGFSHTHLQGTGISDYGDILFMPTNSEVHEGSNWGERYRSIFSKSSEESAPGYYSVFLDDHQMKVELTATTRVGIHRYTPEAGDSITLFIDLEHRDRLKEYSLYPMGDSILVGHRISREWAQEQHVYFAAKFSEPFHYQDQTFEYIEEINEAGDTTLTQQYVAVFPLIFDPVDQLKSKVGLSSVSIEGALENLETEAPHWNFDDYRNDAGNAWTEALNKIEIEGGTDEQRTCFYTSLYHSLTVPNTWQDVNGMYRGTDLEVHEDPGHPYYTIFSLWDTFRSTHPLYTIIERERTNDFIKTFLQMYEDGGQLPIWELAGNYTGCMIGYHSVPVITDAWVKGIRDYDPKLSLEAMLQIADSMHLGKDVFATEGYISAEKEHESVSKTLEYAYDDWCIAVMAKELGDEETYKRFIQRGQFYKNILNPESGFVQAKRNGNWLGQFDPAEVNFNFTEANSYQYSFFAPQDVAGMIEHMGGDSTFCANLDRLFTAPEQTSGREQADITGLIGQYAHGNEPSHHMAYLYNYAGQPWKTQEYARKILDEQYWAGPDGLSGNEDCGQMSSWYVLSAMGIYPVTPGLPVYTFGSPLFDRCTINLENGKQFTIAADGAGAKKYFSSVSLNGELLDRLYVTNDEIMAGGTLEFTMVASPSKDSYTTLEARPPSHIDEHKIAVVPVIGAPRTFTDPFDLEISVPDPTAEIYYTVTVDGVTSDEQVYSNPIPIQTTTTIVAWTITEEGNMSQKIESTALKISGDRQLELFAEYDNQYTAGGPTALIDHLRGGTDFKTGEWQGYWGKDLVAVVDLGEVKPIKRVALGCLQDTKPWIVYPKQVEVLISFDGENYSDHGTAINSIPADDYTLQMTEFEVAIPAKARYVKIIAENYGKLPEWHLGHGGDAWLFVDEIVIE